MGRNGLNIKCPLCGASDPSEHMRLSSAQGWWACLRNRSHRGNEPTRLVRTLLRCGEDEARRIVQGEAALAPTGDDLGASFAALKLRLGASTEVPQGDLRLPREFKPLLDGSCFAEPFLDYLTERGFRSAQIRWLAENYNLHYAVRGPFSYRLIIPIYDRYGGLVSWSGRTILADAQPRYKTLSVHPNPRDPEAPVAKLPANATVLGLPVLHQASNLRVLVGVEGQFDALKLTAFGHTMGVYGACLFGLNVYPSQVAELLELSRNFDGFCMLLDEDAELHRLRLQSQVHPLPCRLLRMPPGSDDPGAMSGEQVVQFCLSLIT